VHFRGGLIYFPEDGGCKFLRNFGKFLQYKLLFFILFWLLWFTRILFFQNFR
jgi:hypothetical protein